MPGMHRAVDVARIRWMANALENRSLERYLGNPSQDIFEKIQTAFRNALQTLDTLGDESEICGSCPDPCCPDDGCRPICDPVQEYLARVLKAADRRGRLKQVKAEIMAAIS